ncbi:MAG: ComF family protein [Spirochaetota bacterium]
MLDLLAPPSCLVCGKRYRYGSRPLHELAHAGELCPRCRAACAPAHHPNRCSKCSIPLPREITVCERCRRESFAFDRAVAATRYDATAALVVQRFKFGRHVSLAREMAALMAPLVAGSAKPGSMLVPAPSRPATVRRRGFSGAELLARHIATLTGYPVARALRLARSRSQKSLSYEARRENLRNAVRLTGASIGTAPVVVVDDVLTTGTTADACARRLKQAGAAQVIVVTFAIEY